MYHHILDDLQTTRSMYFTLDYWFFWVEMRRTWDLDVEVIKIKHTIGREEAWRPRKLGHLRHITVHIHSIPLPSHLVDFSRKDRGIGPCFLPGVRMEQQLLEIVHW